MTLDCDFTRNFADNFERDMLRSLITSWVIDGAGCWYIDRLCKDLNDTDKLFVRSIVMLWRALDFEEVSSLTKREEYKDLIKVYDIVEVEVKSIEALLSEFEGYNIMQLSELLKKAATLAGLVE